MTTSTAPGQDYPHPRSSHSLRSLWAALAGLAIIVVALAVWMIVRGTAAPTVLTVERIDIVEADGTPALVLANSQRVPPATMDGQVIMADQEEARKGSPSIIFFDGRGDEVGGLAFGNIEGGDGFSAVRHFSLDGYKQDQTVVLHHYQHPGGAAAGLSVSDRPWDLSMLDVMDSLRIAPGASRAEMQEAIAAIPEEDREARMRELFGVQCLFLGSSWDDQASLVLNDGEGRPRIWIGVPLEGDPSIRILDEDGEIVGRLP